MTLYRLRQYNFLKKEIKDIEDRIKDINNYTGINYDRIGCKGGGSVSDPTMTTTDRKLRLEHMLQCRLKRAQALLLEIEDYIDTIEDSYIRQAITYHYLQGNSWRYTARVLTSGAVDEVTLSNMVTRYVRRSEAAEIENLGDITEMDENDENNML